MGCYFAPHDAYNLEIIVAVIGHNPIYAELLVPGDLNTYLEYLDKNELVKVIAPAMEMNGIEDMV